MGIEKVKPRFKNKTPRNKKMEKNVFGEVLKSSLTVANQRNAQKRTMVTKKAGISPY